LITALDYQLRKFLIKFKKFFFYFLFISFFSPQLVAKADQEKMLLGFKVFTEKGTCITCHKLANARSVGNIGPSLDDLKPTQAQVKQAVTNGIGIMPAFGNDKILTPQEIEAVSFYVEKVTGN
jgi:mono/diheme cytochrome c family protein